ncbi:orotidine-5'-phosphate decarboxylase [Kordiimonas sp. SCSIO 12610]|uniref:orotidine-5'-phosphate decarboxylase n=1 Tax=Kordiimonas sp. SCSIO 12610 TaxID=2829597 RepID=UPI00210B4726|nr:orotidine-5'-phosphate decarboxylase [Kordiimonas sp. SCSIO 12610]UTW55284.1 orotidine-5'-phosphate decarboxylase [Kordiimonas sp. SCSIO 12610]
MLQSHERIFCALDTTDVSEAVQLSKNLKGYVGGVKLGLEFFMANGADGFKQVADTEIPIFLDLKFHDIPNTVAGAIRAVAPLAPKILTIHTQGGSEMMRRAQETAIEEADKHGLEKPWVVGVTILTSLDENDIGATGIEGAVPTAVERLAKLASTNSLDGVVCSPMEITLLRETISEDFKLVVPGIRPAGSAVGDQKRVLTPKEAVDNGADILVIGRPITQAPDPIKAAQKIAEGLA